MYNMEGSKVTLLAIVPCNGNVVIETLEVTHGKSAAVTTAVLVYDKEGSAGTPSIITFAKDPPSFISIEVSYPVKDNPVMVAPDSFLNCKAVPPTVEIAVILLNFGFPFTLSPSKTVEKPAMV